MTSTSKAKTEHIEDALKQLPCKKCGQSEGHVSANDGWFHAECWNCSNRTGAHRSVAEAVAEWNLRSVRKEREEGEAVAFRWRMNGSQHWSSAHDIVLLPSVPPDSREYQFLYAPPPPASPAVTMGVISLRDPLVILAGIKQFGLASDGSDLRDLEAALTSPAGETAQVVTRELLGQLIYEAVYASQGGVWRAVEPREVWYSKADWLLDQIALSASSLSGKEAAHEYFPNSLHGGPCSVCGLDFAEHPKMPQPLSAKESPEQLREAVIEECASVITSLAAEWKSRGGLPFSGGEWPAYMAKVLRALSTGGGQ